MNDKKYKEERFDRDNFTIVERSAICGPAPTLAQLDSIRGNEAPPLARIRIRDNVLLLRWFENNRETQ